MVPTSIFYKNIEKIFDFCKSADKFGPLKIDNEENEQVLYCWPMEEDGHYQLTCYPHIRNLFSDIIDMDFESEYGEKRESLKENDSIILDIINPKDEENRLIEVYGYGNYRDEELAEQFYNYILDFLDQEDLKIEFFKLKIESVGIVDFDRNTEIYTKAIELFRELSDLNLVHDYVSWVTKKTEYFTPINIVDEEANLKAAYLILPDPESAEKFIEQANETLVDPDAEIEPNGLLLKIYENNGMFALKAETEGDALYYNKRRVREMIQAFFIEIDEVYSNYEEF